MPISELITDALIMASVEGFDVFNALDIMENKIFLEVFTIYSFLFFYLFFKILENFIFDHLL